MIKLNNKLVSELPKLAWIAKFPHRADKITVYHGPCVETHEQWCVEAAWTGDFGQGDFDRTELIFGSGVRCRGTEVIFVSSGTTEDCLWYCDHQGTYYVSNTLPGLLAAAGLSLRDDYPYIDDVRSISKGLSQYVRTVPTSSGDINVLYINNLIYDGTDLKEVEKPDTAPCFKTFDEYHGFLVRTAEQLGANISDRAGSHNVVPMTTISRGYDASATAVISRHANCRTAVTIKQSSSLWRGSDSGADIARRLGLSCKTCNRTAKRYPLEEAIWSVNGRAGVLNWTLFDYPKPLCLLFTGTYGDGIWDRRRYNRSDPFASAAAALSGLSEFRLFKGFFNCPVPFWGRRHYGEIQDISFSKEMEPWTLYHDYDRPIPRRIVEEAGVPRGDFGRRKKNTSLETSFLWPYSPEAKTGLRKFLRERDLYVPSEVVLAMARWGSLVNNMIYTNLTRRFGWSNIGERHLRFKANSLLFHWANNELRLLYESAFMTD
jgi:hypothetical protein